MHIAAFCSAVLWSAQDDPNFFCGCSTEALAVIRDSWLRIRNQYPVYVGRNHELIILKNVYSEVFNADNGLKW